MACLQICLQTGRHRLKPDSIGSNLLTIKTRLPLGTEGIAWYHQKSHKPLKTRYAVLLSSRPLVQVQFGVPRCRNFMNFGIFFYKKFSVYFFGGEKKRKVDSLCPRRNRTFFSKLLMKIGFLLIWRFALSDVLLCPLVTWGLLKKPKATIKMRGYEIQEMKKG